MQAPGTCRSRSPWRNWQCQRRSASGRTHPVLQQHTPWFSESCWLSAWYSPTAHWPSFHSIHHTGRTGNHLHRHWRSGSYPYSQSARSQHTSYRSRPAVHQWPHLQGSSWRRSASRSWSPLQLRWAVQEHPHSQEPHRWWPSRRSLQLCRLRLQSCGL